MCVPLWNLEGTQLSSHLGCQFEALHDEFKEIFSQHHGDTGNAKLIMMDIKMRHVKGFMINVPLVQCIINNSCSIN